MGGLSDDIVVAHRGNALLRRGIRAAVCGEPALTPASTPDAMVNRAA